jgi:hypothetical protein
LVVTHRVQTDGYVGGPEERVVMASEMRIILRSPSPALQQAAMAGEEMDWTATGPDGQLSGRVVAGTHSTRSMVLHCIGPPVVGYVMPRKLRDLPRV